MIAQKSKVPPVVSILGAVTALIAALTPLYLSYFDNTAEKKADLAYELLSQKVEYHDALLKEVLSGMQDLRYAVRLYTLTGALTTELEKESRGDAVDSEVLADKALQLEMMHGIEKEELKATLKASPLPKSLDAELQQRQE